MSEYDEQWDDPDDSYEDGGHFEDYTRDIKELGQEWGVAVNPHLAGVIYDLANSGSYDSYDEIFNHLEAIEELPRMNDPANRRKQLAEALEEDQLDRRDRDE